MDRTQALTTTVWQCAWGRLVVVVREAHCGPVGEEDEAAEVVGGLGPVELAADPASEGLSWGLIVSR